MLQILKGQVSQAATMPCMLQCYWLQELPNTLIIVLFKWLYLFLLFLSVWLAGSREFMSKSNAETFSTPKAYVLLFMVWLFFLFRREKKCLSWEILKVWMPTFVWLWIESIMLEEKKESWGYQQQSPTRTNVTLRLMAKCNLHKFADFFLYFPPSLVPAFWCTLRMSVFSNQALSSHKPELGV